MPHATAQPSPARPSAPQPGPTQPSCLIKRNQPSQYHSTPYVTQSPASPAGVGGGAKGGVACHLVAVLVRPNNSVAGALGALVSWSPPAERAGRTRGLPGNKGARRAAEWGEKQHIVLSVACTPGAPVIKALRGRCKALASGEVSVRKSLTSGIQWWCKRCRCRHCSSCPCCTPNQWCTVRRKPRGSLSRRPCRWGCQKRGCRPCWVQDCVRSRPFV